MPIIRPDAAAAIARWRRAGLVTHDTAFVALLVALFVLAWVALLAWQASPYGRYLSHGDWSASGLVAELCIALPAGNLIVPAMLYAGGWVLMIGAMMLPTTLPLLRIFRRLTMSRPDRRRLLALLIAGYLLAWTGFGLLAHLLDWAVHSAVLATPWLFKHAWVVGVAVLAGAGLFQFSALKYQCLDRCRTPLGFVVQRWSSRRDGRAALALGVDHGLFCIGCCWALMLLMFVVGTGNLAWMLALGAIMAIEKNASWGRRLGKPLGWALIALAAAQALAHLAGAAA